MTFITLTVHTGMMSFEVASIEAVGDLKQADKNARVYLKSGSQWDVEETRDKVCQLAMQAHYATIG